MKKGQMLSQPFIFIFYLIVIATILVLVVKFFNYLNCYKDQVSYNDFNNRFEDKINTVGNDAIGSNIGLGEMLVPSTFSEICFFESPTDEEFDDIYNGKLKIWIQQKFEIINQQHNVFLYSDDVCSSMELMSTKMDLLIDENFCLDLRSDDLDVVLASTSEGVKITRYLN